MWEATTVVLLLLGTALGQVIQNADFETTDHWDCWSIQCVTSTDHHTGQQSLQAKGRTQYYQGPSQPLVGIKPNEKYAVQGWARLLNDKPGRIGQTISISTDYQLSDDSHLYLGVASQPLVRSTDGWIHLQGDFQLPDTEVKMARIYFQGPEGGVAFAVDSLTITPIPVDVNWRKESNDTINKLRKANIDVIVTAGAGVDTSQVQIELVQTKKSFAFGTAVAVGPYVHGDQKYRDFIHNHFNWAVIENALKWDVMETQEGHPDYNVNQGPGMFTAIKQLNANGVKVRAHNIVWSVDQFVPSWLKKYTGDTLKQKVEHRVTDIVSKTKGLVQHWDVNNENLHGFYFQQTLNDSSYNLEIFRIAHRANPDVKLFLNDFSVVAGGEMTQAYLNQALTFKKANVGLYGIGVQCHFPENMAPDPTLIKRHLDILAQAGVPIWVTELDVINSDENKRADWYEIALRSFYGHPAVEGILFWGFWSQAHWKGRDATLVTGNEFRVNAAGQRFLDLVERQWMTHEKHPLNAGGQVTTHGFLGDYEVHVIYKGQLQSKSTFTLDKTGKQVTVQVHQ